MFFRIVVLNFFNIYWKTPVLESLFNKVFIVIKCVFISVLVAFAHRLPFQYNLTLHQIRWQI